MAGILIAHSVCRLQPCSTAVSVVKVGPCSIRTTAEKQCKYWGSRAAKLAATLGTKFCTSFEHWEQQSFRLICEECWVLGTIFDPETSEDQHNSQGTFFTIFLQYFFKKKNLLTRFSTFTHPFSTISCQQVCLTLGWSSVGVFLMFAYRKKNSGLNVIYR